MQGAWVISTIGIVNTVGRLLVGYVSDKPWADAILINTIALGIAGGTTMFVPFYTEFSVLIMYAIAFGFSIGKICLKTLKFVINCYFSLLNSI